MLTKDQILNVKDYQIEEVEVPEWGGSVFVRGLTGAERDEYEASMVQFQGSKIKSMEIRNIRARMAAYAICDADGNRVFSSSDVLALSKKSAAALDRIMTVAARLSGMTAEDQESLRKNLPVAAPMETSEDFVSDSPLL